MPWRLPALAAALLLSACSSFGPDTPAARRVLDPLRDDLSGVVIAFDLPRGIGAAPGVSALTFTAPGVPPLKTVLIDADGDEIAASLPPPANGHAYYFFGLSAADQSALRAAQSAARAANADPAQIGVTITPKLCRSGDIDPAAITISVLAALPAGGHLAPLVDHRRLTDLVGPDPLPACT